MADLTLQDVLTVLQQMDLDVKQLQHQRRVFACVGEVIRNYQAAQQGLEEVAKSREDAEASLVSLRAEMVNEESSLRKRLSVLSDELMVEVNVLKARAADARDTTSRLTAELVIAEMAHSERMLHLDATVGEKSDLLAKIEKSIEQVKKVHGFA